ncbi:MAG: SDR family oxidoreductase [Acetobacteraceae bacterium]|nr:SDR family oxidoreductase [Acetobacteraceae bacterium]
MGPALQQAAQWEGHPGHAVVTGCSSGIGAAIVKRLIADGWRVTGISRTKPEEAAGLTFVAADLLDDQAVQHAVAGIKADALVHAAGFMRVGELGDLDAAAGHAMWQLHVAAPTVLANALVPAMPDGGRIVLLGSRTAAGAAGRSQYAATKAALIGLARSWAIELAPRGITVNVVAPAATETPMLLDPRRSGTLPRKPPIGRFIRPEEVAALTAFLLSKDAAAITGQHLVICGGSSL